MKHTQLNCGTLQWLHILMAHKLDVAGELIEMAVGSFTLNFTLPCVVEKMGEGGGEREEGRGERRERGRRGRRREGGEGGGEEEREEGRGRMEWCHTQSLFSELVLPSFVQGQVEWLSPWFPCGPGERGE